MISRKWSRFNIFRYELIKFVILLWNECSNTVLYTSRISKFIETPFLRLSIWTPFRIKLTVHYSWNTCGLEQWIKECNCISFLFGLHWLWHVSTIDWTNAEYVNSCEEMSPKLFWLAVMKGWAWSFCDGYQNNFQLNHPPVWLDRIKYFRTYSSDRIF